MFKKGLTDAVTLKKDLARLLDDKKQLELFTHTNHHERRLIQKVDFENDVVVDGFNDGSYSIVYHPDIPAGADVRIVFPNHPDTHKQVLRIKDYTYLNSFNKELNERLRNSLNFSDGVGTTRLVVCYGNHAYICQGIQGTVYIVYASYITVTNHSSVANVMHQGVPLIINKDGAMAYKHIFICRSSIRDVDEGDVCCIPLTEQSPEIFFSIKKQIFVCESRKLQRPDNKKRMKMLSFKAVLNRIMTVKSPVDVSQEYNPHAASLDMEEDWTAEYTLGRMPDGGTPRDDIFLQELPSFRSLQRTPPIVHSSSDDDNDEPDPFKEDALSPKKEKEEIIL